MFFQQFRSHFCTKVKPILNQSISGAFQVYLISFAQFCYKIIQQIIKLVMKEPQKSSRKHMGELRKHSISQKTRSDNTNPFGSKDEQFTSLLSRDMKSLGRKYVQENVFKNKQKDHHEIVISDELVRNSKQFRMLREKMQMKQAVYSKQFSQLNQVKSKLKKEITQIKSSSYNSKLALWELKNQILELKGILNDEEDENRRLEKELSSPQQQQYYEEDNAYEDDGNQPVEEEEQFMNNENEENYDDLKRGQLRIHSEQKQNSEQEQEVDIRLVVSELRPKMKMNPENQIDLSKEAFDSESID